MNRRTLFQTLFGGIFGAIAAKALPKTEVTDRITGQLPTPIKFAETPFDDYIECHSMPQVFWGQLAPEFENHRGEGPLDTGPLGCLVPDPHGRFMPVAYDCRGGVAVYDSGFSTIHQITMQEVPLRLEYD